MKPPLLQRLLGVALTVLAAVVAHPEPASAQTRDDAVRAAREAGG